MRKCSLTCRLVVKPSSEGSTVGVSIVRKSAKNSVQALALAKKYDELPMVEEFIAGREITCGVLDNEPLEVVEVKPKSGFYDYEAKYKDGGSDYEAPAKLKTGHPGLGARAFPAGSARRCIAGARRGLISGCIPERGPFVLEVEHHSGDDRAQPAAHERRRGRDQF